MIETFKRVIKANQVVMTSYIRNSEYWARDVRDSNMAFRYYSDGHHDLADAIARKLLEDYGQPEEDS